MYNWVKHMKIDEEEEITDVSDHKLIQIELEIEGLSGEKMKYSKWKEKEYYTTKEHVLEQFKANLETRLSDFPVDNFEELNRQIKIEADKTLKRVYRRRVSSKEEVEERPWFTEEIRQEIAKRKRCNRERRNAKEEEKNMKEQAYKEQKLKVQTLVRQEIYRYEMKTVNGIKNNKDNGRKLWDNINKLKGK